MYTERDVFEVILEARRQTIKIDAEDDTSSEDYTSDIEDSGDGTEDTSTDYTSEDEEVEADADDEESEDDEESTDYTEDDSGEDEESDDTTGEEGEEDSSTDYTEEDSSAEETPPEDNSNPEDKNNKLILFNDMNTLLNMVINTTGKLNAANKSDLLTNRIINQVTKNLNTLIGIMRNYMTLRYLNESYPKCLAEYNFFLEAFKINVQILKKIGDLDITE